MNPPYAVDQDLEFAFKEIVISIATVNQLWLLDLITCLQNKNTCTEIDAAIWQVLAEDAFEYLASFIQNTQISLVANTQTAFSWNNEITAINLLKEHVRTNPAPMFNYILSCVK